MWRRRLWRRGSKRGTVGRRGHGGNDGFDKEEVKVAITVSAENLYLAMAVMGANVCEAEVVEVAGEVKVAKVVKRANLCEGGRDGGDGSR